MQNGIMYSMDFGRGALVPLENPKLPVGQIVTYEDRANPRKEFAVISDAVSVRSMSQAQKLVCLDDGHAAEISFAGGKPCGHWTVTPRVLTAEELAAALKQAEENRVRLEAEHKAASEKAVADRRALREKYVQEFGGVLQLVKPGEYASAAHGSRNLKKELARAFPGVKFSVRSDTFSGGDSIDISWELGPTTREVEEITGKYSEGHFNGMEDIYESSGALWPEMFGGAKYVSESRGMAGAEEIVCRALCARYGYTPPADGKGWWNVSTDQNNYSRNLAGDARELVFKQSYPAGVTITGIEDKPDKWGGTESRAVFTTADGKPCTWGTPEASAAHFRAEFADWQGSSKETLRGLAKKTGRAIADLFNQYNVWERAQFDADHHADRSLEVFAMLPEFQAPAVEPAPAPAAPVAAPVQSATPGGITVKFNRQKNGVEIHFAVKPGASVLSDLKARGWRWSRFSACWYQRRDSLSVSHAVKLAGLTDAQSVALFAGADKYGNPTGPDRFDMQVEDNMRDACGL